MRVNWGLSVTSLNLTYLKAKRKTGRERRGRWRGEKEGVRGGEREEQEERKEKKQDEDKERKKQYCWCSDMNSLWVQVQLAPGSQRGGPGLSLSIWTVHSPCGWGSHAG